jgi:putative peptide zinc metalloprotease protein
MKRLTLFCIAALLALALAGWKPATAQAQDNVVIALNTMDGTSLIRFAFKIARVSKDVVDQSNAAVGVAAGCTECEAIAAAFQIVLVFSNPDVVTPQNIAIAMNVECTECVAFASAFQWVLGTGGPVHFTPEGNRLLAEIKQRLHDLEQRAEGLTLDELIAELEAIQAEIADILATELAPAGQPEDGETTTTEPPTTTAEPDATTTAPGTTATTTEPAGTTTSP